MNLKRLFLTILVFSALSWTVAKAQSQQTNYERPPELEGHAQYLRSLLKEEKNAEVARWFFKKNQRLNSSKYYTLAARFYAMAEKPDSAAISINMALDNGMSNPNIIEKEGLASIRETSLWQNIKPKLNALDQKLHNIENFQIDTEPMDSFWPYFNLAVADTSRAKEKLSQYILSGSQATREFYSDVYKSLDDMYRVMIVEHSELYKNCQKLFTPENLESIRSTVLSGMTELKKIYPDAVFPKVYMMPGILDAGGRSTSLGLFVGAEKFVLTKDGSYTLNTDAVKSIIMHELMHFQQEYQDKANSEKLIGKVIQEGVCDFLAELCTGIKEENANLEYLEISENRDFILSEFKKDLFVEDVNNWMYNYKVKDRPVDIGYTLGYLISKSYYRKNNDKKQAVHDLLNTDDFREIVAQSDYGFVLEDNENAQTTKKQIDVASNPNIHTSHIIEPFVWSGDYSTRPMVVEGKKYFQPYKDHPAVQLSDSLLINEIFYFDELTEILLYAEQFPKRGFRYPLEGTPYADRKDIIEKWVGLIADFYTDANVDQFLNDNKAYYEGAQKEVIKNLPPDNFVQLMEEYYRAQQLKYTVIPSPEMPVGGGAYGYRGIGPYVYTDDGMLIYQVIGASLPVGMKSNVEDYSEFGFDNKDFTLRNSYHEFGHAFVNPLFEKDESLVEQAMAHEELFTQEFKDVLNTSGYRDWLTVIQEHLVRLGEIRLAERSGDNDWAKELREYHIDESKFIFLPEMEKEIKKYEEDQRFETFAEYVPTLLKVLDNFTINEVNERLDK